MQLSINENYVNLVERGKDAFHPLILETLRGVPLHVDGGVALLSTLARRIGAKKLHEALAARWRAERRWPSICLTHRVVSRP
jgi:hypothetical protein